MKQARLGVLASLGIGVFVSYAQGGNGWEIKRQPWGDSSKKDWEVKRQPWGSSSQQWSESGQWSEQWKWTADQQLPAAPGSAWQFSQSSTVAPPLPPGASSQGKWTWIPSPSSSGFYWSYSSSSSSSPSSAAQGLGAAPGTPWQFSQSSATPPPLPAGQSVGSWTWVSGPSGGYYWSFIPGAKQDLPPPPGTAWQFSQSSTVAPPLPAGSGQGTWKWISAPSRGGYYWSFIAGPKQNLPPAPGKFKFPDTTLRIVADEKLGTEWIFSTSSTTAPPLPAGVSGAGTWKWVSSPDGKGYYWSFISSGGQRKLPETPTGGSGWIFSTSSTTPPPLPAGVSGPGSWKWVSSPDGKGYYWSYISSSKTREPADKLPEPPTGGTGWIFSTSSIVPPTLLAGVSGTGSWKWVSSPDGKGYYWSFISSPPSPQQQLPQPSSGSTEWIFSPSKTTPPSLPSGISGTAGTWKWVSAPSGEGYYWSFTPSNPAIQQLPAPKPGSSGWIFSESRTEPPKIAGITPSGSWTWISSGSGQGYYWTWSPGAPQEVPSGFQGGVVTPGSGITGQQGSGIGGSFDTKPSSGSGNIPTQPDHSFGGLPIQPEQQGVSPQTQPGQQGGFPHVQPGQQEGFPDQSSQGGVLVNPQQPSTGGFDHLKPDTGGSGDIKGPFEQGFDHTGKPISGGDVPSAHPGSHDSGNVPTYGGDILQGGSQPQTGDQGPIKGPFGGSFDLTGKPGSGGDVPSTRPGSQGSGNVPIHGGDIPQGGSETQPHTGDQGQVPIKGPFGGSFDHTGKPVDSTGGSTITDQQSTGGVPVHPLTGDQPGTRPGDQGQVPIQGPFGGSFDHTGKPIDKPIEGGGSTTGSHSSGGFPVQQPGTTGQLPSHEIPQTGGTSSIPGSGDAGVVQGPFGGYFDHAGKPVDVKPIEGGGSTSGSHSSGGFPVQQPGTTGETPFNPQTGGEGSIPTTGSEEDVVKGLFGGFFDKTGKPMDSGSQGTYKCPPRSRIELLDAPTVPEATCPNSQDRRYSAGGGKDFYILCCRHVDGGKKEIAVIPDIPSLQHCIHICAGTANCKSVLYTARQGYNSNYPLKSCQLFEHGDYDVQTPCNNDAHDSAYLIEPPTGTTGGIPPIAVDPPISPPPQVGVPPSFIMLPPGISEHCVQNVLAAIKCGTCASC
ncbi:hypothetical protein BKA65DRAFT_485188 [Rhexocercosporidium sp. MPI-PUGE-AT-0058]|nr:hypothetical protein BKA65DRAFT_485188 [Rhexocercosporidium sp. MPI-PUGE-AT-0058]